MAFTPMISVLCLSYNQSQYIEDSLNSIKNQEFNDFEIIICDDASKDNSVAIIENWIKNNSQFNIKFIAHKENKGICKSLNECLGLSKGKYIQVLALDDLLLPWKFKKHVDILSNSDEKYALIFSDALLIDQNTNYYQNRFIAYHKTYLSLDSGNYFEDLLEKNFIPAMTVFMKRSLFDSVGLFDEDLGFEDYDMWLRIASKYDFIFDVEPSASYRLHSTNTHRLMKKEMSVDAFRIYMKYSDDDKIKNRLHEELEHLYLNDALRGQEKLYYNKYAPENVLDHMIYQKKSKFVYKVLREFMRIRK